MIGNDKTSRSRRLGERHAEEGTDIISNHNAGHVGHFIVPPDPVLRKLQQKRSECSDESKKKIGRLVTFWLVRRVVCCVVSLSPENPWRGAGASCVGEGLDSSMPLGALGTAYTDSSPHPSPLNGVLTRVHSRSNNSRKFPVLGKGPGQEIFCALPSFQR